MKNIINKLTIPGRTIVIATMCLMFANAYSVTIKNSTTCSLTLTSTWVKKRTGKFSAILKLYDALASSKTDTVPSSPKDITVIERDGIESISIDVQNPEDCGIFNFDYRIPVNSYKQKFEIKEDGRILVWSEYRDFLDRFF